MATVTKSEAISIMCYEREGIIRDKERYACIDDPELHEQLDRFIAAYEMAIRALGGALV